MNTEVIILAAGQGKRMYSNKAKVLHKIAGKEMLIHILDTIKNLNLSKIHIVIGHLSEQIINTINIKTNNINFIKQEEQLGTAHAVKQAIPYITSKYSLILYGDTPLIQVETLKKLLQSVDNEVISILTAKTQNPFGYGRIIRQNNEIIKIIEQKDADANEILIKEINTGIIVVKNTFLNKFLKQSNNSNNSNEYYLTDIIEFAKSQNINIKSLMLDDESEILGANNKKQLAHIERVYQKKQVEFYLEKGVSFADPKRVDFRGSVQFKKDVFIDINVIFEGSVQIGNNVSIGAGSVIKDSIIEDNVSIKPFSIIEGAHLKLNSDCGPFARLRNGSIIGNNVHIGNFVEIKNSNIGSFTKAGHLTYIGDADVGQNVNIGAGTITCNYDGHKKHKTIIEENCFIGSNASLVAPIQIQKNSLIAAGSTITKNIESNQIAFGRSKQINKQK